MTEVRLVVQKIGGVVVVTLGGSSILEAAAIDALGRRLFELVDEQAHRKILLDFTQVKFLSSTMLGVLIRLQKRLQAINGRLAIYGLRPELHKVFKITRLEKLFNFYDNEQDALNSFGTYGH
jgi:anti-sigma B factor antagonist